MGIKARYEDGNFVPLEKVDLKKGEIVELDVSKEESFSWKGALKNIKKDSVELQHRIKETW